MLTAARTFFDVVAEFADRVFDARTPRIVRARRGALLFGGMPFGDVFERREPSAVRQRPFGDRQHAPVGERDDLRRDLLLRDAAHHVGDILLDIALEAADRGAVFEDLAKLAARLHEIRVHAEHLDIALIADDQPQIAVPHAQALSHVVQGELDLRVLPAEAEHHPEYDPDDDEGDGRDPGCVGIGQCTGERGYGVRHGRCHPSEAARIIDSGHFFTVNDCFLFDGCARKRAIPRPPPWCSVPSGRLAGRKAGRKALQ